MKFAVLVSATILLSLPALTRAQASQTSDPVADAARRSRQAKQNAAKPHKVYTDDDVSRPKTAPAPDASATTTSGQAATTPDASPKPAATAAAADANNEATWRKRFQGQRDNIARAEKELDILQRETQKAQVQYYPDPQKALSEQYTRKDILDKEAKIDAKRQEITQLKQGLSDLEDELRKSGGDPGWAR